MLASRFRNDAEHSRTLPDTGSRHAVRVPLISRRPCVEDEGSDNLSNGAGNAMMAAVSAVPACGRVLADVGPTRVDAKAFDVARRPVRHVAPPPHQDRRPRRRDEDHDPGALAELMPPLLISCASLWDAYRASSHDRRGMRPQTFTDVPSTRKPSSLKLRLQAGADEPRPNVCEVQKNHPNPAQPCANSSKRCIKRARTAATSCDHFAGRRKAQDRPLTPRTSPKPPRPAAYTSSPRTNAYSASARN